MPQQSRPLWALVQGVAVKTADGVASRIELERDLSHLADADVSRQQRVERARDSGGGVPAAGHERRDLARSVRACVGAPCQRHADRLTGKGAKGPLQRALYRWYVPLELGATVGVALILQD